MKCTTSMSLLNKDTLANQRNFSIYTHNSRGEVVSIAIPPDTRTVSEAIQVAIAQFTHFHSVTLEGSGNDYRLYAAKPNGTRFKEYPSLDGEQELTLININQFYLRQDKVKARLSQTPSSIKKSQIASTFDSERRLERRAKGKDGGCFCFGR